MKFIKLSDLKQYYGDYSIPNALCGVDSLEEFNAVTFREAFLRCPVHCAYVREDGTLVYEMKVFYSGQTVPGPSCWGEVRLEVLERLLGITHEEADDLWHEFVYLRHKDFEDGHCERQWGEYRIDLFQSFDCERQNTMEVDGNAARHNVARYVLVFNKA